MLLNTLKIDSDSDKSALAGLSQGCAVQFDLQDCTLP